MVASTLEAGPEAFDLRLLQESGEDFDASSWIGFGDFVDIEHRVESPAEHIAVRDGVLHFGFPTDAGGGLFGIGRGVGLGEDDGLFSKRIEFLGFAMDRPVEQ